MKDPWQDPHENLYIIFAHNSAGKESLNLKKEEIR